MKPHRTLAAEDFSYFLQEREGCFFFIGSSPNPLVESNEGKWIGDIKPHHRADFDIDENALFIGTSVWLTLVQHLLSKTS